jgi:hypothetical protein
MTASEMRAVSNLFEHLSDWLLGVIRDNPKAVAELAANEKLVRNIRKGQA